MKILFLTNNLISESLIDWLRSDMGEEVFVIHDKISREYVDKYKPDIIVSYNYRYLIKKDVLDLLPDRVINLHISLLPWNRGAYPNVWSFLENTPKGVTIHCIDEGLDTGDIILQKEISINEEKETLKTSYEILNKEIQEVFKDNWSKIKNNEILPQKQQGGGSMHRVKEGEFFKKSLGEKGWDMTIREFKKNLSIYEK